jgi:hypothetical protein
MRRGQEKVIIGREHRQLMTNAQLRKHGVNRADLQAGATTAIAQFCGVDMILPLRGQKRQGRETIDNVFARPRAGESLQQFLQDQSRGYDGIATFKGIAQGAHLRSRRGAVASKRKRPDASVDK